MDWEAHGLLEGCADDAARADRRALLEELHADGVTIDELRRAAAEDRLTLLPVERFLWSEPRYSAREISERVGVPVEWLEESRRALGLPVLSSDEVAFGEQELEAAGISHALLQAGMDRDDVLALLRQLGAAMAAYAQAARTLFADTFMQAGDTEHELARRYRGQAEAMFPLMDAGARHVMRMHLREQLRNDVVTAAERRSGRRRQTEDVAVAFADVVGFTELGRGDDGHALGAVAQRLAHRASEVARPPVRLVKTIGDAVMLVAPDPAPLLDAVLDLVRRAEEDDVLPQLRAGIAYGPALPRLGDWYGSTVNLASRVTDRARPGSVLVTREVHDAAGEEYRFSAAGEKKLRGIGAVPLYRARPGGAEVSPSSGA